LVILGGASRRGAYEPAIDGTDRHQRRGGVRSRRVASAATGDGDRARHAGRRGGAGASRRLLRTACMPQLTCPTSARPLEADRLTDAHWFEIKNAIAELVMAARRLGVPDDEIRELLCVHLGHD